MPQNPNIFLTAEWRDLLLLNYEADPALLRRFVPQGTQLDAFEGKSYLSLVGFRFRETKLHGTLAIPFHSNFEELNLRFYVRRLVDGEIRRGVVFIAEIVPRLAIAATARLCYGENYVRRPMQHRFETSGAAKRVKYAWKELSGWCSIEAEFAGEPSFPSKGSGEQFLAEHYWGYSAQKDGSAVEYRVEHAPWKIWACSETRFCGNPAKLYGEELSEVLHKRPDSAFVAEGSPVTVYRGQKLA